MEEMFTYADADHDSHINWSEFQTMISPTQPEQWATRPAMTHMARKSTLIHPHTLLVSSMANREADIQARMGKPLLINNAKLLPWQ
jgi:hypothetical protein